jgi:sugar O-acyltransferase (sialic acid O-acetyltransferase NeuD family)
MRLVVFGVSNLLSNIFDCALALGLTPSLVVMNMPEVTRPRTRSVTDRVMQLPTPPRIVQMEEFSPREGECYFLGTTSPQRRTLVEEIRSRFGITCCTLVHPTAYVTPGASLASGVYVGAGSFIGAGCRLDEHVWVGSKVHVGHDTIVDSYARLWPSCNMGGNVHVGYGTTVGMGANIIEELEIGPEAYIAAGAVVIEDVPARALVAGVPATFKKTL